MSDGREETHEKRQRCSRQDVAIDETHRGRVDGPGGTRVTELGRTEFCAVPSLHSGQGDMDPELGDKPRSHLHPEMVTAWG